MSFVNQVTRLTIVYIVYDVWIFFELVIVFFFFRETQGLSLEETAALYDGQLAVDNIAAGGAAATEKARMGHMEDIDEKHSSSPVAVLDA